MSAAIGTDTRPPSFVPRLSSHAPRTGCNLVTAMAQRRVAVHCGCMRSVLGWVVVAAVAGSLSACSSGSDAAGEPLAASTSASSVQDPSVATSSRAVVPPGTRLVGLGHAAIAVPTEWGTNQRDCGVPQQDTVVVDGGLFVEGCGARRPAGVDSVEMWQGAPRLDYEPDETTEIDEVPAERQNTNCSPDPFGSGVVCAGTIYFPSLQVSFRAESSTSAAEVDRILEWIIIVPDQVGVPGFRRIHDIHQEGAEEKYLEALREAGLTADVQTGRSPGLNNRPGFVLDVSPAPGTLVQPGDVVTVTVSGAG